MESIEQRFKRLVGESDAKHIKVAAAAGISRSHFSELMSGKKCLEKLGARQFMDLCLTLCVTPEYFLDGEGDKMSDARTGQEAQLLMLFRAVPEDKKTFLMDMLKAASLSGNDAAA